LSFGAGASLPTRGSSAVSDVLSDLEAWPSAWSQSMSSKCCPTANQ
jgi:hypothetical protein